MTFETLTKALDKIDGKLQQLPELAERVFALEQKGITPPAIEGMPSGEWAAKRAALTGRDGLTVLRKSDDFRAYYGGSHEREYVGLAPLLRGIAGMKTTELATKALSVGTDSAGGYAVPRATFGEIMGALVPNSALLLAGAGVIPVGDTKSVTTAVVNSLPTAAWRAEAGAIAESDPTFRAVVATPKSLSFRFKVSRELLMDAPNMERALNIVIAQAMAKELDRAGLRGSGTDPEPRGILNTAGIYTAGSGTNGASGPGYDTILSVFDDILQQDAPQPTAAIMSPRSLIRIAAANDTTGQPKRRPDILGNLQLVSTSQIPNTLAVGTSTDCSELYVGDFTNMAFMMRETVSVQVLNELHAATGEIGFVGHVRADVVVTYPAAFAVVTGLR